MLDYLDLASLETKTIADGNEIITKGVSIKINENMNINEIMAISEEAVHLRFLVVSHRIIHLL